MRIGVDATCWQNTRGYGRHARALLTTLVQTDGENHYTFVMDSTDHTRSVPDEAALRFVRTRAPTTRVASAGSQRSAAHIWRMGRAMSSRDFDLLLFPTVYSYVPVLSRAKKVLFVHDVIAERYPRLALGGAADRLFWKAKVALGMRQADAIVTVSDYSRRAIAEHFKIADRHVFVVGEASDPAFRVLTDPETTTRLEALGVSTLHHTIVYVGGFGPHKNLQALLAVFARLASQSAFSNLQLVMVGEYEREVFHTDIRTIREQIKALAIEDRVIFTGYLPDEDLAVLLNLSTVLVLPSLMEGFGLPAIEAAACGCPVIATTASPLPELLGDGGLYVDPLSQQELQIALARVLESEALRQRMRTAGITAASRLTWDAAARQMVGVIQEVAAW